MSRAPARIFPVSRLDLRVGAGGWHEAEAHRAEIDAHFQGLQAKNPHLWNGRIILLRDHVLEDGVLSGTCFETDFAAFNWWRARGINDLGALNIFAPAALEGSDGAFVMGEMGDHTASAGAIYFPGGTPAPQDVKHGVLDLRGSALREMEEETGLSLQDVREEGGWDLAWDGIYFGLMRRLIFNETGAALAARICDFLAAEKKPELKAVRVIASEADLVPAVAPYAADYARWRWSLA
ncbi:NUDIX hydrolase [Aquabacter sp. CN5-332]|uniref:NUDIX hydrolase n=1 Tax=Aquabacter sp. CN5-332 TaxID=3156608 RepID=UPI0032B4AFEE